MSNPQPPNPTPTPLLPPSSTLVQTLRSTSREPHALGQICAVLLNLIPTLVNRHLEHDAAYNNSTKTEDYMGSAKCPALLANLDPEVRQRVYLNSFIQAVDNNLSTWRKRDGVIDAFPDELAAPLDRKQRAGWRRCRERYLSELKGMVVAMVVESLYDELFAYHEEANRRFNRGFDRGWCGREVFRREEYPGKSMVLESRGGEWEEWLRVEVEEQGKRNWRIEGRRGTYEK